ncbi:MAG TPA: hypothetical protein VGZ50_02410, partial [Actinomycetota bacterium]|nr:hypothetical protein [Actinomycetota bacterium]
KQNVVSDHLLQVDGPIDQRVLVVTLRRIPSKEFRDLETKPLAEALQASGTLICDGSRDRA